MKYDGFLYGNGLTINLLFQLKQYIPQEKQYLLNIDGFLQKLVAGEISPREENKVLVGIYRQSNINTQRSFSILKEELRNYYKQFDGNIEFVLGQQLFVDNPSFDFKGLISIFPALYNIWWLILFEYLLFLKLNDKIDKFYKSVIRILGNPQNVWTTNFDLFSESLNPEHLHGYFLSDVKEYQNVVYKFINGGNQFYFKYIWGHNGLGKLELINRLKSYEDYKDYFDFDFFFNQSRKLERLLIYGISFQEAGYIVPMKNAYSKYQKASVGGLVDEHILWRIKAMLDSECLEHVDVAYFNDKEKEHFLEIMEAEKISKFSLVKSQELLFSV